MIKVLDKIWIGNSADCHPAGASGLHRIGIHGVLNVAYDLPSRASVGRPDFAYHHVGLLDGPGNEIVDYYAAVLILESLARAGNTLVCCHSGSRSLAVALIYQNVTFCRTWNECLEMIKERTDFDLPDCHEAHQEAFKKINWKALGVLMR